MHKTKEAAFSITSGDAFYKALLLFYPEQYRRQFGHEMLLTFQDMYKDELAKHGKAGVGFWFSIGIDTVKSIIAQHRDTLEQQGMKNYLHHTLHVNKFNVLGFFLLLPFMLLLGSDYLGRLIQGNFSHPNTAVYDYLSQTILYSEFRGQAFLLWAILVISPLLAVILNLIPFISSLRLDKKKLTISTLLFASPLALIIIGMGTLFIIIAIGHDAIPCFIHRLMSDGLGNILRTISICKNA